MKTNSNLMLTGLFFITLFFTKIYAQTNYYVDQSTGDDSDNGQSLSNAFKTIDAAVAAVSGGDTIYIVGAYTNPSYNANYSFGQTHDSHLWHAENTIRINGLNGSANNYITFKPYDDTTIIKGDGSNIIRITNSSYLRFEGLTIKGEVDNIPLSTANALQFVYLDDDQTVNINNPTSAEIKLRTNDCVANCVPGVTEDEVLTDISNDNIVRPSYIDTRGVYFTDVHHIDFVGNTIYNMPGGGFRLSEGEDVTIADNEIYACARKSYSGTHALVVTKAKSTRTTNDYRIKILRNKVHHNYNEQYSWSPAKTKITPHIDEGKGISLQRNQTKRNNNNVITHDWENGRILIENNICYLNGFSGIHSNDGDRIDIINNTCYFNSYTKSIYEGITSSVNGGNIGISAQGGKNVKIFNNISIIDKALSKSAIASNISEADGLVVKNNLIYGTSIDGETGTINENQNVSNVQENQIKADPLFVDPLEFNFYLRQGSPAIGAANNNNAPTADYYGIPRDSSADIGAIEDPVSYACSATTTWNGNSWDNGAPSYQNIAVINGNYNTAGNGSIDACALTVNAGKTLTVAPETYIRTVNNIMNAGAFIVAHTGNVVQINDNVSFTNTGNVSVQVTSPELAPGDYVVSGSPLTATTVTDAYSEADRVWDYTSANFVPHPDVASQFPNAVNFQDDNNDVLNWYSGILNPAEGYIVRRNLGTGAAPAQLQFTFSEGTLSTGAISFSTTFNNNQNDSPNLLSNPYASALDANALILANDNLSEIYFWEHIQTPQASFPGNLAYNYSMEDISMYNLSGGVKAASDATQSQVTKPNYVISTSQGFGIKPSNGSPIVFHNNMRLVSGNTTLRTQEQDINKIWLSIFNDAYQIGNEMLLAFNPLATENLDLGYDSARLANYVSLYSHINNTSHELSIQTREAFTTAQQISLGFSSMIAEESTYTIKIDNLEGVDLQDTSIYLFDNITGVETNLTETGEYQFIAQEGDQPNRFMLYFEPNVVLGSQNVNDDSIRLFPNPASNAVSIIAPSVISNIEIYDLQGRLVRQHSANATAANVSLANLQPAVYIVKAFTQNGTVTAKIIKK